MLEVVFVLTYVDADVRDFHVFGSASWKLYGTVSPVYGIRSPVYFQHTLAERVVVKLVSEIWVIWAYARRMDVYIAYLFLYVLS